ncbi:fungal-specific transcription factor domain-containing protein [Cristinia sonorae]|uniref:Fungal-specific transcription factor domain-containing protein n=1 Tax=Cristinia sonorae TaxID=1940300 RepID=A0A8K0UP33_9AGAR|nr:fungal-specific transcription factor domain-containing protein [Cristinia sonorae]
MPVPTSSQSSEARTSMSSDSPFRSPSIDRPFVESNTHAVSDLGRSSDGFDSDQVEEHSRRSTPSQTTTDSTQSPPTGKGGCWTCRVRRKKCDEEREGDSCKTCLRLRIKCLGWGPKRPEWMRDKDKVAEYKASIKEQLTRAGLIRGQPRTVYQMPSKNIVPSQSGLYPTVGGSTSSRRSYDIDLEYRSAYASHSNSPMHASGVVPVLPSNAPHDTPSIPSYFDPTPNDSMLYHSPMLPMVGSPDPLSYDMLGGDLSSIGSLTPSTPSVPNSPPMPDSSPSHDEYILYYFNHVRPLQFVFAGNSVTNLLYSMLYAEPRGVLSSALCALASLHSARLRIAQGLDTVQQHSIPKYFYDQAAYQMMNKKTMNGQYSEQDAIAAAYLVSFSILSSGSTNWTPMLEVACDWLSQTGIHEDQNPKLTLMNMSHSGRFAAQATMWIDIMSSVTFLRTPRFISLYRRLFKSGAGFWASTGESFECRMDSLTGCPDEALLAIAEIAALAHWKSTEIRNGCLSIRELVRRADLIQRDLKTYLDCEKPPGQIKDSILPSLVSGDAPDLTAPTDEVRLLIAKIHRENALLYLHTVLNDAHPGVSDITGSIAILSDLFQRLPVTDFDRSIIFPLCLTASMTDEPVLREHLMHRCATHNDDYVGNMYQARTLIGAVWNRRHQVLSMTRRAMPVEWRECLRERWSNLLLV